MFARRCQLWGALLVATVVGSAVWTMAQTAPGRQRGVPDQDRLKPRWNVGDSWVVEAVTRPVQIRESAADKPEAERNKGAGAEESPPVRWQFKVANRESLFGHECFRLNIQAADDPDSQPRSSLWVDVRSLAIRKLQSQVPVPGGFATITESYTFEGQPAPVLSPLSALPVDLPMFVQGRAAGEQTFRYDAVSGPAGKKALGDIGFAVDVTQSVRPVDPGRVRGLVPPGFRRDLENRPLAEVQLKSSEREVRQIWQAGQPWPVYSDNQTTKARLVKVTTAKVQP